MTCVRCKRELGDVYNGTIHEMQQLEFYCPIWMDDSVCKEVNEE